MRTGLSLLERDADDRHEVLVVALGADVARVDAVLGQRRGHLRVLDQQLVAVVVEVADDRHAHPEIVELAPDLRARRAAAASLLTVTRTSSEPACASAATWRAVASASAVSVLVIDWTTIGWSEPTSTPPTSTVGVCRRPGAGHGPCSLTACPYVEERHPDEQRHQEDEAGQVDERSTTTLTPIAGRGLDEATATRPPSSGGNGSALTTARLADSKPMNQIRKTGGASCGPVPIALTIPTGPDTGGLARLVMKSPRPRRMSVAAVDRPLGADDDAVDDAALDAWVPEWVAG